MAFCTRCGHELIEPGRFCSSCGTSTQPEAVRVTVTNPYAGKKMQLAGMALLFISLPIVIGAIGNEQALMAWFFLLVFLVGAGLYVAGKWAHWYHAE